jgi:uncharacterized protein (TIGR03437 family)
MASAYSFYVIAVICACTASGETTDLFERLTMAKLAGSGGDTIRAMTTDEAGNIYVVGATSSPDFPVLNAIQPTLAAAQILRTSDRGDTWTKLPSLPDRAAPTFIQPDPRSPAMVFAGSTTALYKSTDGAQTWRSTWHGGAVHGITIDTANPAWVYATTERGAIVSSDTGETWQSIKDGNLAKIITDPLGSGAILATASVQGGVLLSRDHGQTWKLVGPSSTLYAGTVAFDWAQPGAMYLSGTTSSAGTFAASLWHTSDWGATWKPLQPPSNQGIYGDLVVDPDNPRVLYAVSSGLYRSDDAGGSWILLAPVPPPVGSYFTALPRACSGGALFGVGAVNSLQRSVDNGATWTGLLNGVRALGVGAACSLYVLHDFGGDGFVAKLSSDGTPIWSTYLGGLGDDAVSAVAVDAVGNVYISGYTTSSDFPVASQGAATASAVEPFLSYASKLDSSGQLVYTTILEGGSGISGGMAVDSAGNLYVSGYTSTGQPVQPTPGAYAPPDAEGYVAKITSDGSIGYIATLPSPGGIASPAIGELLVATFGGLIHLGQNGELISLDQSTPWANARLIATDSSGNVYLGGSTTAPDFPFTSAWAPRSHNCPQVVDRNHPNFSGAAYVVKLRAMDMQLDYAALLSGECPTDIRTMAVGIDGTVAVGLETRATAFPLVNAVAGPFGSFASVSALVAKLSSDGTTLALSSYVNGDFGPLVNGYFGPLVAIAADGSVLTAPPSTHASVVRLPVTPPPPGPVITSIGNAFSGGSPGVSPGSLVAINGRHLGPDPPIDLGLNSSSDLPAELGGTRVLFNDIEAPIMITSDGRVVCIVPDGLPDTAVVQVEFGGQQSNAFEVAVVRSAPALLTRDFPDVDPYDPLPIANVRNQDGSLNDPDHPAAAGSTVLLFLTGIHAGDPVFLFSNQYSAQVPPPVPVPGFVPPLYQIAVTVPPFASNGSVQLLLITIEYGRTRFVGMYVK